MCLQRQLDSRPDGNRERQFISHVLEYLNSRSGYQVEIENWMITSYEIDFGHRIGVGGLCVHIALPFNVVLAHSPSTLVVKFMRVFGTRPTSRSKCSSHTAASLQVLQYVTRDKDYYSLFLITGVHLRLFVEK